MNYREAPPSTAINEAWSTLRGHVPPKFCMSGAHSEKEKDIHGSVKRNRGLDAYVHIHVHISACEGGEKRIEVINYTRWTRRNARARERERRYLPTTRDAI